MSKIGHHKPQNTYQSMGHLHGLKMYSLFMFWSTVLVNTEKEFGDLLFPKCFPNLSVGIASTINRDGEKIIAKEHSKYFKHCFWTFSFDATKGVMQSGILLPILSNIYFDEFWHFQQNDIGCHIGIIFMEAFCLQQVEDYRKWKNMQRIYTMWCHF